MGNKRSRHNQFLRRRRSTLGAFFQADGKIIVGGRVQKTLGRYVFALVRYDAAGNLDPSFGVGGKVTTELFDDERAVDVAFQTDGKTVVMGGAILNGNVGTALARYNTDGGLDSSFGAGGKVLLDFREGSMNSYAVTVEADNKIVIAGQVTANTPLAPGFALRRFNSDGSLDTVFGIGGLVTTDFGGGLAIARRVAIGRDGKIVAAGIAINPSLTALNSSLALYNYDGSLDQTFGTGGRLISPLLISYEQLFCLAIQSDGKIITGGNNVNGFAFVARYNVNGSLDSSFASVGYVTTQFVDGRNSNVQALAIQADGKIVAAGTVFLPVSPLEDFGLMRFDGGSFDICVQDDSNGSFLQLNTTSGDYQFSTCSGITLTGRGQLRKRGGVITLQHNASDRRLLATVDTSLKTATASVQLFSEGRTFMLIDRTITDDVCHCH